MKTGKEADKVKRWYEIRRTYSYFYLRQQIVENRGSIKELANREQLKGRGGSRRWC